MKTDVLQILKEVFGYNDFRPLQEEIVMSVLEKRDTVALLPTGGGKSVCFQVPALLFEGLCLVVSPLIALMKDQVDGLKKKGVMAVAVYSGMSKREIDTALDNCIYGNYKFLYVSPERLKSEMFIARFRQMNISMVAIDEAHCISQWGYDFRPSYLDIAALKEYHPQVPFIALTASATLAVKKDIIEKLQLQRPRVFVQSFARENLSYSMREVENKLEKAMDILQKVPGSAIVYVRNRKGTKEIASNLQSIGIKATYYHAGMDNAQKELHQTDWMNGKSRVMVATNAFGMGIDKPDVRMVVHYDLPENLENYYQEAGRAGRDGNKAYAVLLTREQDRIGLLGKAKIAYPPLDFIKKTYQSLANFYRIAVGSSLMVSYDFDISNFAQTYNLDILLTYNAVKVLQEEGLVEMNESFFNPSTIRFLVDQARLYEFQIAYAKLDPLIKVLLRMHGGELFTEYIKIQEPRIAKMLSLPESMIVKMMEQMDQLGVLGYNKRKDKPQITFLTPRYDAGKLPLDIRRIEARGKNAVEKANAIVSYSKNDSVCRTIQLLYYFGENEDRRCGVCDVCVQLKKEEKKTRREIEARDKLLKTLSNGQSFVMKELLHKTGLLDEEWIATILREMADEGILYWDKEEKIKLIR